MMDSVLNSPQADECVALNERSAKSRTLDTLVCLLMALAPVFDPYVVPLGSSGVRIVDIAVFGIAAVLIVTRKCSWTRKGVSLVIVAAVFIVCTVISTIDDVVGRNSAVALKVAVAYFVYAGCYSMLSGRIVLNLFARIAMIVASVSTVLVFVQFFSHGSFWNGQLPLPLSKTDVFISLIDPTTGQIRPHGLFQEASYYALYVAPVLMYALLKRRVAVALLLTCGLLLSSSFLGFIALLFALVVLISQVKNIAGKIDWGIVVLLVVPLLIFVIVLVFLVDSGSVSFINTIADGIARKIQSILDINTTYSWGRSSAQQRLLGNIALFGDYDPLQKAFGMGVGQYINVFSGVETTYGSSAVNVLLGFGIFGELALAIWAILLVKHSRPRTSIFALIVLLALFVDNVLFGWYFFYLLSWVDEKESSSDTHLNSPTDYSFDCTAVPDCTCETKWVNL